LLSVFGAPPTRGGQRPTVVGDLLVVLSLFAGVGWVLLSKRLMTTYARGVVTAVVMVTGTILLDAWVLATSGVPPIRSLRSADSIPTHHVLLTWRHG
jgi:hypothetical protein